jgi:hypothetical protein
MTNDPIADALANLGNWRVIHIQAATWPYNVWAASELLALGYHETGLKNECGGAVLENGKWVQAYTDRGVFQFNDTYQSAWLASVPGCLNGQWTLDPAGVSALTAMHCPRFSDALSHALVELNGNLEFAASHGVPRAQQKRFAIAAHNAGAGGALDGFRMGNVDQFTANGNYSASVLGAAPDIHAWIVAHPGWQYVH